jgi:hypothetical protein
VTGLAQVKYSNALVISDSLYQAHIQPLIQLICDQLTEAYLHTAVQAYGFTIEQARRLRVWYDASEILTDSDRSDAASTGVGNYALSFAAWRRENGFTEADAPSPNELVLRILLARAGLEDPTADGVRALPDRERRAHLNHQVAGGRAAGAKRGRQPRGSAATSTQPGPRRRRP